MKQVLDEERRGYTIFPPEKETFKALELCPINKTKVVILGQDPYHTKGLAHGLAFSVPNGQKIPPSLRNILKEVQDDLAREPASSGDLTSWAKQGVLLLNTCLTVRKGEPASHKNIGWDVFCTSVLETIVLKQQNVVFLLWGRHAQRQARFLHQKEHSSHLILEASHPSPFSAKGFFGCKHFSKTNDFLVSVGKEPIIW